MFTYELTPNLKTKSYRVLDNGIEVARSLAKKTAKFFCDTHNQLLNQLENAYVTQPNDSCATAISSDSESNQEDNSIRYVRLDDSCEATARVLTERAEYSASIHTKDKSDEILGRMARSIEQGRIEAEEHGRRAEEHGRRAEEHEENARQIQAIRDELIPFLLGVGSDIGGIEQNQVPQLQPCERPLRRITQADLGDS